MNTGIPRLLGALVLLAPGAAAGQQVGLDSIIRIMRLPRTTTEAREKGVPDSSVGGILDVLQRAKVPAADAQEILDAEIRARDEGRATGNFGEFVQAQHRAGLRGRALADAIHREQARRGMGRGQQRGKPEDDDRDDNGARGGRGGRPDTASAATQRTRGRSDTAGPATPRTRGRTDTTTSRTPTRGRKP
jgi:hypothetical protein